MLLPVLEKQKKFIRINKSTATWRDTIPSSTRCEHLSADDVIHCVEFLLNNIYITFNNTVYRQKIGIPIGSDCAQELANLYLMSFELDHVNSLLTNGDEKAESLQFASRYIDDLLSLNDMGYIDETYSDIYPKEMKLNKTNNVSTAANYLDLNIAIVNGKFVTRLYDKRRDYNFKIISLPHMSSNVPTNPTYGVFISQVHRFLIANSDVKYFYDEVKGLTSKLIGQGFVKSKMKYFLCKYFLVIF